MSGGEISGNTAGGNGNGVGRNVSAIVSGTHQLNSEAPRNAVIIAWNRPAGNPPFMNYTAGSHTDLTVSAAATATWANQSGVSSGTGLGISYRHGTNTGWIRQW